MNNAGETTAARDSRALRSIAVQFFVNGAVVASYVPRLPGIRDQLGASLSTIGIIIAIATAGGVLGSVVVGPVITRIGTKRLMIFGSSILVGLLPFVAFTNAAWQLLIILIGISITDVLVDVAMNMQGSLLSKRRAFPVMNRLHGMWSVGTVIGGLTASIMEAQDVSLRAHLLVAAAVLLATLLYVGPGLLSHDEPEEPITRTQGNSAGRIAIMFGLLGAAAIIPEMITSDWSAFRLTDDLAASGAVAGLGYVAFTSGMVTGRFSGDSLAQRSSNLGLLRGATAVAAAGLAIANLVPAIPAVFIGLYVAGLGVSLMFPQLYDAAAQSVRPGVALGGLTAGTRLALFVAPAIIGILADSDAFTVGAACALLTIPAAFAVLGLSARSSAA